MKAAQGTATQGGDDLGIGEGNLSSPRRSPLTIRFALIALLLASVIPLAAGMGVSAFLTRKRPSG